MTEITKYLLHFNEVKSNIGKENIENEITKVRIVDNLSAAIYSMLFSVSNQPVGVNNMLYKAKNPIA